MNLDLNDLEILIVDDTPASVALLRATLEPEGYRISMAPNGEIALEMVSRHMPDLILLDILMPGIDGFETCRQLKINQSAREIPIIFITSKNETENIVRGFSLGCVDYIPTPFRQEEICARVKTHLRLRQLIKELYSTRLEVIRRLGRASQCRDNGTGMHVLRMSQFAARLGLRSGLSEEESDLLRHASPMHDIGKIGIPDRILKKTGKLLPDEWEVMQSHVNIGEELLDGSDFDLMQMAKRIAAEHHEKWDGSGYPRGLKGEEISLEGRIAALCDVFDALISERPYKKAWSVEEATKFIEEKKGQYFDPYLVEKLMEILPEIQEIRQQFPED